MRAGNLYHRVAFYGKVATVNSDFGGTIDTWPAITLVTRCEIRDVYGSLMNNNDARTYEKTREITVRYRPEIVETMKVQLDDTTTSYSITYIETIGRNEGLKISLIKTGDDMVAGATTEYSYLYNETYLIDTAYLT
jgi:SPP1 family predicted phage head-tail adaptor